MNIKKSPRLTKESPIMLEKLLSGNSKEPNLLASPNAFDWEKRLTMPGGSPDAFSLSLNAQTTDVPVTGEDNTSQLFDYPTSSPNAQFSSLMIDHMVASIHAEPGQNTFTGHHHHHQGENVGTFSDSPASMEAAPLFEPLPPKRTFHDRKDSHRESERRRRETFKTAMFHLENLVVLTLNRAGSCKIMGKGPNRKLSHAEVYKMARDIIVTLKEETVKIEHLNQEMIQKLHN